MSTVHIEWSPDPIVFGEAILEVEEALQHTEIPLALAMQEVQADIRERFETRTNPDGTKWDDWAESYEEYAISFPNMGILDQHGGGRDGSGGYLREDAENALVINGDTLFFDEGAIPERGIWHQEGRPSRKTKQGSPNPLPSRRFLGLTTESVIFIEAAFNDWFDNSIDIYETSTRRLGRRHARMGVHPMTGHKGFIPRSAPMPMRIR